MWIISRRFAPALAAVLLLTLLALPVIAGPTGGMYTYYINGDETAFTFDPIVRRDGLLLPSDVISRIGIAIHNPNARSFSLEREGVTIACSLGWPVCMLNKTETLVLKVAPLRSGGYLFIPSEILVEFGYEFSQDGNTVLIRDNVDDRVSRPGRASLDELSAVRIPRTAAASVRAENNFLKAEFILLSEQLVNNVNFMPALRHRASVLRAGDAYTLLQLKITNDVGLKPLTFQATGFFLVDEQGRQYDQLPLTIDIQGVLTGKIAPYATKVGVLAFEKVPEGVTTLTLYMDGVNGPVGTFRGLN